MSPVNAAKQTLQVLQVFRGLAATAVVLFHVTWQGTHVYHRPFLAGAFLFGHVGIDFFFVLSGFIILYVHYGQAGRPRAAWTFLKARFARIYPAYWVVLAATIAAYSWISPPGKYELTSDQLVRAVLLYDQRTLPVVAIAWTLSFEVLFYLVFTIYLVLGRAAFGAAVALWAGAIVLRSYDLWHVPYPLVLSPLILEFFLGCLAAHLVAARRLRLGARWLLAAAALCLLIAGAEVTGLVDPYRNVRNYALPFFFLVLTGAAFEAGRRRRCPALLVLLGEASYALYLTHYVAKDFAFLFYYRHPAIVGRLGLDAGLALMAAGLLALGVGFHLAVERPLLALARRALGIGGARRGEA